MLRHGSWCRVSFFRSYISQNVRVLAKKSSIQSSVSTVLEVTKMSCECFVALLATLDVAGALVYARGDIHLSGAGLRVFVPKNLVHRGFLSGALSPWKWREVIKEETYGWGYGWGGHRKLSFLKESSRQRPRSAMSRKTSRWGFGWVDKAQCFRSARRFGAAGSSPDFSRGFSRHGAPRPLSWTFFQCTLLSYPGQPSYS